MIIVDLVKTVYKDLKKKQLMAEKMSVDDDIRKLQLKKKELQAEYEKLDL